MTTKHIYNLVSEPTNRAYEKLVNFAAQKRFIALLATRDPEWVSPNGKSVLERLQSWQLSRASVSEWPGTILHGGTASVYLIQLGNGAEEVLKHACSRLYEWVHPELPEDLGFLRSDRSPWLVTISHEADGYFELYQDELKELEANLPEIEIRPAETDGNA